MFSSAKQAEVIRSNQKDDYYQGYLRGSLTDIVQSVWGAHTWIQWRRELDLLADLGYFALTTFAGYQTLGEEYVNILQVDSSLRAIPSKLSRLGMILLQVAAPYTVDRFLLYAESQVRHNPHLRLTPEGRTRLLNILPPIRHAITILHRCHLALFYMRGFFYHIAKRIVSIHYILVRGGSGEERTGYRVLGWLSIIQLTLTFLQQVYKVIRMRQGQQVSNLVADLIPKETVSGEASVEESQGYIMPGSRCSLCLEARKHSTATPCGHMFCWACIMEWCSNKAECPLCREKFEISRLIFLQNYDPT